VQRLSGLFDIGCGDPRAMVGRRIMTCSWDSRVSTRRTLRRAPNIWPRLSSVKRLPGGGAVREWRRTSGVQILRRRLPEIFPGKGRATSVR
jgi:hypothetical protein